ncbi:MAG: methyltransferase [Paracoccaceae bacterium]
MTVRLGLAFAAGLALPDDGQVALFRPGQDFDLTSLPRDRVRVLHGFRPDFDHFERFGLPVTANPDGRYTLSVVSLPKSKPQARALIWQALSHTDGPVVVDGQKTDGIDSMLKAIRKRVPVSDAVSKAHGKLFWFHANPSDFADWAPQPTELNGGWITEPGCFSADGPDPASALLADTLPEKLGKHVVDLGAGWGYLSARVLANPSVAQLDLVEAEHVALDCARRNVEDSRARFHWADALHWTPEARPDAIVMNPPFHTGRAADPALGRAFIAAAARMLPQHGVLWMVANRHLPYETTLDAQFGDWAEITGDNRFKIFRAARPTRQVRRSRLS